MYIKHRTPSFYCDLMKDTPLWYKAHSGPSSSPWKKKRRHSLQHHRHTTGSRVSETENGIRISMDIPGVKAKNVTLEFQNHDGVLVVSGECKKLQDGSFITFHKSFAVDTNRIDTTQIKANLADGVLVVTAPKKTDREPKVQVIAITEDPHKNDDDDVMEEDENENKEAPTEQEDEHKHAPETEENGTPTEKEDETTNEKQTIEATPEGGKRLRGATRG